MREKGVSLLKINHVTNTLKLMKIVIKKGMLDASNWFLNNDLWKQIRN